MFIELKGNLRGYFVDENGVVISRKPTGRFKSKKCRDLKPKEDYVLTQRLNKYGYYDVGLRFEDKEGNKYKRPFEVHRLVAIAHIPNPYKLPQVNHIDGDRKNNHISNLEWCTVRYNVQDAIKRSCNVYRGERNKTAKLKNCDIPIIMEMRKQGVYVKDIALKFNVAKSTIQNIVSGYQWNHITGLPNKKLKYRSKQVKQNEY